MAAKSILQAKKDIPKTPDESIFRLSFYLCVTPYGKENTIFYEEVIFIDFSPLFMTSLRRVD